MGIHGQLLKFGTAPYTVKLEAGYHTILPQESPNITILDLFKVKIDVGGDRKQVSY